MFLRKIQAAFFILFISTFSVFGQIDKGSIYIGANMGISLFQSQASTLNTSSPQWNRVYNFSPNIGYFLSSKFAVGIQFGFTYSSLIQNITLNPNTGNASDLNFRQNSKSYSIAPNLTYVIPISEKLFLFSNASLFLGYSNTPNTEPLNNYYVNITNSSITASFSIQPSLVYFLSKKVSLNLTLGNLIAVAYVSNTVQTDINYPQFTVSSPSSTQNNTYFTFLGINSNLTSSSASNLGNNSLLPSIGVSFWLK